MAYDPRGAVASYAQATSRLGPLPTMAPLAKPAGPKSGFVDDVQRGVGFVAQGLGSALQDTRFSGFGQTVRDFGERTIANNPADYPSVYDVDGVGSALGFAVERVGEFLPQLAGGVAGGLVGSLAGPGGTAAGLTLGFGAPTFATTYGGARDEQRAQGIEDIPRALTSAAGATALDVALGAVKPLRGMFGGAAEEVAGGVLSRMGRGAAEEAGTEVVQQGLQRWGGYQDLTGPEATEEYLTSAAAGAAVGGIMGALPHRQKTTAKPAGEVTNEDLLDTIDSELGLSPPLALPEPPRQTAGDPGVIGAASPLELQPGQNYRNLSDDFLPQVLDVLQRREAASPGQYAGVLEALQAELDRRNAPMPEVQTELELPPPLQALPPEHQLNLFQPPTYDDVTGEQPPAEPTFDDRLAAAKKGLRNQFVVGLKARDEVDLLDQVERQLFEQQDDRKGTIQLGQRLGLLDTDLNPTPLVDEVRGRRAVAPEVVVEAAGQPAPVDQPPAATATPAAEPEASVDKAWAREWRELSKGARDDVKALAPVSREDLERKVYTALGATRGQGAFDKRTGETNVSESMETLGQKLGLLDANKDWTDKFKQLALKDPIPLEETVAAAIDQGYTGQDAAMFERGVQAYLGQSAPATTKSFAELKAFQDGQKWAEQRNRAGLDVLTAQETEDRELYRARSDAQVANAINQGAVVGPETRFRYDDDFTASPEKRQQAATNALVDGAGFDATRDATQLATLKRMVVEGAAPEQVREAIQQAKAGQLVPVAGRSETVVTTPERGAPRQKLYRFTEDNKKAAFGRIDEAFKAGQMTPYDRVQLIAKTRQVRTLPEARRLEREIASYERAVKLLPVDKVAPPVAAAPAKPKTKAPAKPRPKTQAEAQAAKPKVHPAWATKFEKQHAGQVVWSDGEVALLRAQSAVTGQPVYLAVANGRGVTRVDITKYTGDGLTVEQRQRLTAARLDAVAADEAAQATTPDGPFTSAGSNVVGSDGVDLRYVGYLSTLMQKMGLGKIRVFLFHPEDMQDGGRDRYNLFGDYHSALSAGLDVNEDGSVRAFGPRGKDFYISVRPGMSEQRTIETIAHELGHLIDRVAFKSAPTEVQAAVYKEFHAWLATTRGMTAPEVIRSLRNSATGEAQSAGIADDAQLSVYWRSFGEWFADQTSKWATTSEKPVGVVAKFFKTLAAQLRKLVRLVTGANPPAASVKAFLDAMGPTPAATWEGTTVREADKMVTGVNARFYGDDANRLAEAELRQGVGEAADINGPVHRATGWWIGDDGKWRQEISDADMRWADGWSWDRLKQGRSDGRLFGEVFKHEELLKRYTGVASIRLGTMPGRDARVSPDGRHITLGRDIPEHEIFDVIVHELQHAVQERENFAPGGGPGSTDLTPHVLERMVDYYDQMLADPDLIPGLAPAFQRKRELVQEALIASRKYEMVTAQLAAPESSNEQRLLEQMLAPVQMEVRGAQAALTGQVLNTDSVQHDIYSLLHGEVEARFTEGRREFTQAQLRRVDVAPRDWDPWGKVRSMSQTFLTPAQGGAAFSVRSINERLPKVLSMATAFKKQVPGIENLKANTRRSALGMFSVHHIVEQYRKWFDRGGGVNGLDAYERALHERDTVTSRYAQLFQNAYDAYEKLDGTNKPVAEAINRLMQYTQFRIDPAKSWKEHVWLQDSPDKAQLEQLVARANKEYNTVRRAKADKVYHDLSKVNDTIMMSSLAMSLHHMVVTDPVVMDSIQGFTADPTEEFMRRSSLHENPDNARAYWVKLIEAQTAAVQAYLVAQRGAIAQETSEVRKVDALRRITPLEKRVAAINQTMQITAQAPYFHLGRFGQHFVAWSVRKTADGKRPDPRAVRHVAETLAAKGFDQIVISPETVRSNMYVRMDTVDAQERLRQAVNELQQQGWLDPEVEIKAGTNPDPTGTGSTGEWVDNFISRIKSDESIDPEDRDRLVAQAHELALEMVPDNSLARVLAHRESVPGFSADMMRSFAFRSQVGVQAIANQSTAPKLNQAYSDMRGARNAANASQDVDPQQRASMQAIVDELNRRDFDRATAPRSEIIDQLRAVNHAFFLGMSPSYIAVNLTQLGVTLWPQLAKKYGFVRSAKVMADVTPIAFKIIKATFAEGRQISTARAMDATITEKALTRAGVSPAIAEFVMQQANRGQIDIGSAARELGRAAEGQSTGRMDNFLRYASAAGYYSETFTRLVAALAARELHGTAPGVSDYAAHVVDEAMLNYAQWNQARQTGRRGFAGPLTPVMTAFMQYTFQVTEKLYRELGTAFLDQAATPAERSEARRFLGAHLTAVTALAGTLGLPMATVFARAIEVLKDLFDDDEQPYDVKAAWHGWLSGMFGEDVGEMIAHGALRGAGIDIASRVGEQDLLPFSRFLADKRAWDDRVKDLAVQTFGSPASMVSSWIEGMGQIMSGNVLEGMTTAAPSALKGPLKAYKMSADGYTDKQGNTLPRMTVEANDILAQAIGFNPSERAEYNEERMVQSARKGQLIREASNIRKNLANAVEQGDGEAAQEWLDKARTFDLANPAYGVLQNMERTLMQRARARALAETTGHPLGTNYKDIGALSVSGFNY